MTTATAPMLFSEFVDFILLRLYELEQQDRDAAGRYFSLNEIAATLKDPVPFAWIRDAGKVLQSRQLANAVFSLGGHARAHLSGEGRLFVEEGRGAIKKLRKHASDLYLVNVSGSNNQVVVGQGDTTVTQTMTIEKERQPAFQLVDDIKRTIESDGTLNPQEKADLVTDVDQIRAQLKKREPNRPALSALLEPISQISSVATKVADLASLLNP